MMQKTRESPCLELADAVANKGITLAPTNVFKYFSPTETPNVRPSSTSKIRAMREIRVASRLQTTRVRKSASFSVKISEGSMWNSCGEGRRPDAPGCGIRSPHKKKTQHTANASGKTRRVFRASLRSFLVPSSRNHLPKTAQSGLLYARRGRWLRIFSEILGLLLYENWAWEGLLLYFGAEEDQFVVRHFNLRSSLSSWRSSPEINLGLVMLGRQKCAKPQERGGKKLNAVPKAACRRRGPESRRLPEPRFRCTTARGERKGVNVVDSNPEGWKVQVFYFVLARPMLDVQNIWKWRHRESCSAWWKGWSKEHSARLGKTKVSYKPPNSKSREGANNRKSDPRVFQKAKIKSTSRVQTSDRQSRRVKTVVESTATGEQRLQFNAQEQMKIGKGGVWVELNMNIQRSRASMAMVYIANFMVEQKSESDRRWFNWKFQPSENSAIRRSVHLRREQLNCKYFGTSGRVVIIDFHVDQGHRQMVRRIRVERDSSWALIETVANKTADRRIEDDLLTGEDVHNASKLWTWESNPSRCSYDVAKEKSRRGRSTPTRGHTPRGQDTITGLGGCRCCGWQRHERCSRRARQRRAPSRDKEGVRAYARAAQLGRRTQRHSTQTRRQGLNAPGFSSENDEAGLEQDRGSSWQQALSAVSGARHLLSGNAQRMIRGTKRKRPRKGSKRREMPVKLRETRGERQCTAEEKPRGDEQEEGKGDVCPWDENKTAGSSGTAAGRVSFSRYKGNPKFQFGH
ncbi:hypothetical protein DFH06DRAFT_1311455 [Mycena polygramma]|nr:hypothetical protein DFH06DRAFT_1311455 [Mycena polygramma]